MNNNNFELNPYKSIEKKFSINLDGYDLMSTS